MVWDQWYQGRGALWDRCCPVCLDRGIQGYKGEGLPGSVTSVWATLAGELVKMQIPGPSPVVLIQPSLGNQGLEEEEQSGEASWRKQ